MPSRSWEGEISGSGAGISDILGKVSKSMEKKLNGLLGDVVSAK
jgi:hypothetical protein